MKMRIDKSWNNRAAGYVKDDTGLFHLPPCSDDPAIPDAYRALNQVRRFTVED
jgi:hypothetical protein